MLFHKTLQFCCKSVSFGVSIATAHNNNNNNVFSFETCCVILPLPCNLFCDNADLHHKEVELYVYNSSFMKMSGCGSLQF